MPSASASTAATVNPGERASVRSAYLRSCRTVSMPQGASENRASLQRQPDGGARPVAGLAVPDMGRALRRARQEVLDVPGDHPLLVRGKDVDGERTEMAEPFADAFANGGRVLADAAGKYQGIEARERRGERAH